MTTTNAVAATDTYAGSSKLRQSANAASSMGMQDFLQLLVAQLSNQNVMDPMDNTDFVAQMAQFSMLNAMQTLSEVGNMQYATSLIGKNVTVASYDSTGKYFQDEGVVERVNLFNDDPTIVVNGEEYQLASVMRIVNELPEAPAETTE